MKKLLAILCAVALVATCCAVSFTAFADTTFNTEERFLYDFSTKESYEANKNFVNNAGTNISLAYDETEGALKAYPTKPGAGNHQVRFSPSQGATTVKVDEYPVIALKVKFNNTGNPAFGGINAGTNKNSRPSGDKTSSVYSNGFLSGVAKTGQWQLIIYDGTKKVWKATDSTTSKTYCGTWEGLIFMLTGNGATTTANDYCHIEWAGMFKTIQEVYEYEDEMVTPYVYNFEDETATNKMLTAQNKRVLGTNASLAYDSSKKALKIDANDGATGIEFRPVADSPFTTMATSYPVIAFKIKVNNTASSFGELFIGTEQASRTVSGGNFNNSLGVISDKPAGTWQLVIIDGSSLAYNPNDPNTKTWFDGTYGNMVMKLLANNAAATANDIWWVQWFGAFATVEDAKAYDPDLNATPFFYNFEDEDDVNKLVSKNFINVNNTDLSIGYNQTEGALQLSTKNGGSANHQFVINPATQTSIKVADYPVIAMMVKFKNTGNPVFYGLNAGTHKSHRAPGASTGSSYTCEYNYQHATYSNSNFSNTALKDAEGDWQLVVFDGTKVVYNPETGAGKKEYYGYHIGTIFLMTQNGAASAVGVDDYYIKWAGAFPSVEAAYAACGTHEYTNACDTACNICNGGTREANHETTKDANITEASYFVAGSKDIVCAECETVIKEDVVIPATEAALNGDFTETFADGKLTISWTYSDALALDILDGAVITFNYEIAGYENAVVLDGETGASVTLEGFNADRLNADLTYNLSAVYGDVDTAKLNAVGGAVKTADIANDEKLDALLEALEADAVVDGEAENTQWLVSNIAKLDLKAAKAELNVAASQELIDALAAKGGRTDRAVKLIVKIGDNFTKEFEINNLRKYTIVTISGLSFEQLNGDISVQLVFDYANNEYDFETDEIVFACGDMIADADTAAANAFVAYMN